MEDLKFVYFGGEPLGVPILEELKAANMLPDLVITSPDKPVGRKQILTAPPTKVWATENNLMVWQPENFNDKDLVTEKLKDYDLFIVVAYNKILPQWLLDLPKHKTLNVHPSLLPLLRGASPIRSAILRDMREEIGVSIMQLDNKMDHGPIVTQKHVDFTDQDWPIKGPILDKLLAMEGGRLLAATIPGYLRDDFELQEQEHEYATYCGKFTKEDSKLEIDPHNLPAGEIAYQNLLKIYALMGGPDTFFHYDKKRIKIKDAEISKEGQLKIIEVVPEGKPPQSFETWLKNQS